FRLILKVTDNDGVTTVATRDILPQVANVTLQTNVPGLTVSLDGSPRELPYSIDGVVGLQRTLDAPASQTIGANSYQFVGWSDNGARSHQINWPAVTTVYVAQYALVSTAYLSALTPTSATNGWGSIEMDRSNGELGAADGHTITLNGVSYAHGIGA